MFESIVSLCLLGLPAEPPEAERAPLGGEVLLIRLEDEAITPATARFIERAMRQAEEERAACVVIMLDTPGGLLDATRSIVKQILRSDVPVVVYVAPSGGRAASAGVFITLAAHVSAMAPGTHIGAAHPVELGGLPASPDAQKGQKDTRQDKIVNDTVAWARALAQLRGRNEDWAARTVKESLSVPAAEAVRDRAVDLIAADVPDLLARIDGRQVELPQGTVRLRTSGAPVRTLEMWWGEKLLAVLSNPNVAFLLLIFGVYGILFEFYTPGWGVAGTLGVICLVLGFFALAILPINYVGLALILIALALFVAEAFVTSYGFLTIGGVICLILGGLMLVESPLGFQRISLAVLLPVALASGLVTTFLVGSIIQAHRRQPRTGSEGLVGLGAQAVEEFGGLNGAFVGMVRCRGELWRARSPRPVKTGQSLRVQGRHGLTLTVAESPDHQ